MPNLESKWAKDTILSDFPSGDYERIFDENKYRPVSFSEESAALRQLKELRLMYEGKAGQSGGGFLRLLYFSFVTITTLGYGDILPTSNAARLLVALESILGILILGLFLNDVARKRAYG